MTEDPADRPRRLPEPVEEDLFPYDTHLDDLFPQRRKIAVGEGWVVYEAEHDGAPYLISDSGYFADFLSDDDHLLDELISVMRFESPAHRRAYLEARLGWALRGISWKEWMEEQSRSPRPRVRNAAARPTTLM